MKIFQGIRECGCCNVTVTSGAATRDLPLRLMWANHSPTGFEWGYAGSGPAQLALAILAEFLPKNQSLRLHQQFKFQKICHLPRNGWIMREEEIVTWITSKQANTSGEYDKNGVQ